MPTSNAEKLWSWKRPSLFGMPQWWVYLLGEGKGWEKKTPHILRVQHDILWPWKERIQWMNSSTWSLSFNILVSMDGFFGHKTLNFDKHLQLFRVDAEILAGKCGDHFSLQGVRRSRPYHHFSYICSYYIEHVIWSTWCSWHWKKHAN